MKYIRTKDWGFYTFPTRVPHRDFALDNYIAKEDIASAGYVSDGKCCGRSVSLGLMAQPNDTEDLRKQMGITLEVDK